LKNDTTSIGPEGWWLIEKYSVKIKGESRYGPKHRRIFGLPQLLYFICVTNSII